MEESGDGPLILVEDSGAEKGCRQIFKRTALTTNLSYFFRIRERIKAPYEHQRETCENYYPCGVYASHHGYAAAYRHYFGRRTTK